MLGQEPTCIADSGGKQFRLFQKPLAAGIGWPQLEHQVLDLLKHLVGERVVDLEISRNFGEQIGGFALGILPELPAGRVRLRPIKAKHLVEPQDVGREGRNLVTAGDK